MGIQRRWRRLSRLRAKELRSAILQGTASIKRLLVELVATRIKRCAFLSPFAARGFNATDYADRLSACFGKASSYELEAVDQNAWPDLKKNPRDEAGNVIEEQRLWSMPLPGPWRHGSVKDFLKNYVVNNTGSSASGGNDEQVDGCCKVPPLVALYAGDARLLPTVDQAVRVTQNTDKAASFACGFARILEALVLEKASTVKEACDQTRAALRDESRAFVTPKDVEVDAALGMIEDLAGVPTSSVGAKVQETLGLPRHSSAIS